MVTCFESVPPRHASRRLVESMPVFSQEEGRNESVMTEQIVDSAEQQLLAAILADLHHQLLAHRSKLASPSSLDAGLEFHVRSIVSETQRALEFDDGKESLVSVDYHDRDALHAHGEMSAARDVDPAEPLMAAEVLFNVALPLIATETASMSRRNRDLEVARHLHHAIWRRFPPGAIAYVEVLRARLQAAQIETRQRISRELHDRIAHGIAAGLQRLDVTQDTNSDEGIRSAISILRDALTDAQDLALDLRALVGNRDLADALEEYTFASGGHGIVPILVIETGNPRPLPELVKEELFAIVVEATRNARQHAVGAQAVTIRLDWSEASLLTTVADDGGGYNVTERRPRGLGLAGIAERAVALGAKVNFSGELGQPRISISLPFVVHADEGAPGVDDD